MKEEIKIICISDTHDQLDEILSGIPDGDILVHTGDFTDKGTIAEVIRFNDQIGSLSHENKLVIPGNHDVCCDNSDKNTSKLFRRLHWSFQRRYLGIDSNTPAENFLTNCTYRIIFG